MLRRILDDGDDRVVSLDWIKDKSKRHATPMQEGLGFVDVVRNGASEDRCLYFRGRVPVLQRACA